MNGLARLRWRRAFIALAAALALPVVCGSGAGAAPTAPTAPSTTGAYGNGKNSPTTVAATTPTTTPPPKSVPHDGGTDPSAAAPKSKHHGIAGLPFTGGDVMALTFIGVGLVLMGSALPGDPRRRRHFSRSPHS